MATTSYDAYNVSSNAYYKHIAAAPDGTVYVVENDTGGGYKGLGKFSPTGTHTAHWVATSFTPRSITCDADGNIYASTETTNEIYKITPAGSVSLLATTTTDPSYLVVVGDYIYGSGRNNSGSTRLYKVHRSTGSFTTITVAARAMYVSRSQDGAYVYTGQVNGANKMTRYTVADGTVDGTYSDAITRTGPSCSDSSGNLYISNSFSGAFTSTISKRAAGGGTTSGWVTLPVNIYWIEMGAGDYLYAGSYASGTKTIYKVNTSAGTYTTFTTLPAGDQYDSLTVDAQNIVWVEDLSNGKVYRIDDDYIPLSGGGTVSLTAAADFIIPAAASLDVIMRTTTSISAAAQFTVETTAALKRALRMFVSTPSGTAFTVEADGALQLDVPLEGPPGGLWDDDLNDWVFEPNESWEPEV